MGREAGLDRAPGTVKCWSRFTLDPLTRSRPLARLHRMTTYRITASAYRITVGVAVGIIPVIILAIGVAR